MFPVQRELEKKIKTQIEILMPILDIGCSIKGFQNVLFNRLSNDFHTLTLSSERVINHGTFWISLFINRFYLKNCV